MICALALCLTYAIAVDGDTLKQGDTRYRLWGIDAPERADPGAAQSTATLRALILGQTLTCDVLDVDRYQRPVIRCDLPDGTDLACRLVQAGAADDWPKYSKGAYAGCAE